jgi:thymidylate synthase
MMYESDYNDLVYRTIARGEYRECRNGDTRALFGQTLTIRELSDGYFPLLTQRRIYYKGVLGELAAFLRGATTLLEYQRWGCNYWDGNAKAWARNKDIENPAHILVGQVYGAQWVNWEKTGFNQLEALVKGLVDDPHSRRHVITSFSPTAEACLPPCHLMAQFYVHADGRLDCQVYMRSVDLILGLPSDVVLYAGLLSLVADQCQMRPGNLTFCLGDTHVYETHAQTYLEVQRHNRLYSPPMYHLGKTDLFDFKPDDIEVYDYKYCESVAYDLHV